MSDEDPAEEWELLTVRKQSHGPSYVVDVYDGEWLTCEHLHIAGVNVSISDEAEIECKSFSIEKDRDGGPYRKTLYIDPIEDQ